MYEGYGIGICTLVFPRSDKGSKQSLRGGRNEHFRKPNGYKTMVQALFILLHFFGVVRSEELKREMVKFFKENVNTQRSIIRLRVISYFP